MMVKYELLLGGGKRIQIGEDDRKELLKFEEYNKRTKSDPLITLGDNKFRISMVKGVFFFEEKNEAKMSKIDFPSFDREWNQTCSKLTTLSIEDKVKATLKRIAGITDKLIIEIPEDEFAVMTSQMRDFYEQNPRYPSCPIRVWYPFLRGRIKSKMSLVVERVLSAHIANQNAVDDWVKFQLWEEKLTKK